jgi:hypothetical protein
MVSIIKVTSVQDTSGNNETTTENIKKAYNNSPKVWTHFDADASIDGSFNSSSITDNGTGNFDVNFTNNMADFSYAASQLTQNNTDVGYNGISVDHIGVYIRLLSNQAAYDRNSNQLIVVGDLA